MDFEGPKKAFQNFDRSNEFAEHQATYENLSARTEVSCSAYPGEHYGEDRRIRQNVLTYRQVLLHRAILLYEGSLFALSENNPYSMSLSIRGHFETTAAIGYLHNRLNSFKNGTIKAEVVDQDLCAQLLGSRQISLSEVPEPKQILTMLEYADKSVSKHVLGGTTRQFEYLTDCYTYLCEFCHPNFHSNSMAMELDESVPEFKFKHGQKMSKRAFDLIGYLLISGPLFVDLFDSLEDLVPEP